MIKLMVTAAAATLLLATSASAGWDRSQVFDPAFDRSYDRQIEIAADREGAVPVVASASAISTHDAAEVSGKSYFGAKVDRFVDSVDSPYNN
jgi:hypothetical protein